MNLYGCPKKICFLNSSAATMSIASFVWVVLVWREALRSEELSYNYGLCLTFGVDYVYVT